MRVAHVQLSQSSCPEGLEQKVLSALEFSGMNGPGCQESFLNTGDLVLCIMIVYGV